ncbi:hypothetical protein FACS1894216_04960 [Synergistales bacterium]|nr:hypothetical protein FACS1894216_04960 [Synergistales bacterium]
MKHAYREYCSNCGRWTACSVGDIDVGEYKIECAYCHEMLLPCSMCRDVVGGCAYEDCDVSREAIMEVAFPKKREEEQK